MSGGRFDVLERFELMFDAPEAAFERFVRLRGRKRRRQRFAAGVVGMAVFAAAVWIAATGAFLDRTTEPVVPPPGVDQALVDGINTCRHLLLSPLEVGSTLGFYVEGVTPVGGPSGGGCRYTSANMIHGGGHLVVSAYLAGSAPAPLERSEAVGGIGDEARFTHLGNPDATYGPGSATSIIDVRTGDLMLRFSASRYLPREDIAGFERGTMLNLARTALSGIAELDRATPSDAERVGFIGLPPEGAMPSQPETGELVLSLYGMSGGERTKLWVYADGRFIWQRDADRPFGANELSTGYLEQRLTTEGVELLRSEAISTGLFERDLELNVPMVPYWNFIGVRDGDRLVVLTWFPNSADDRPRDATPEETSALDRLVPRLAEPASWLPASAWADPEIRPYVPSSYAVCYSGSGQTLEAPQVLAALPARAGELLRDRPRTRLDADLEPVFCSEVSTEEARAIAESLETAGVERAAEANAYALVYRYVKLGRHRTSISISFEPYFPHGEWVCSPCG